MATRRSMNRWRLELLRLTRSPRGLAILGVYLCFGLVGPLLAKYMPDLVKHSASSGMQIIMPPPVPADGIANYVNQAGQVGLIVALIIAAGSLSIDGHRGLALFYRTRAGNSLAMLLPRFVVTAVVAATGYLMGTAAAWYGTWAILGWLPAQRVIPGALCGAVFLIFAVALVAAASTFARGTAGSFGIAAVVLLFVLPILGMVDPLGTWVPTALLTAPTELAKGAGLGDAMRAVAVSAVAVPALVALAAYRSGRREI